MKRLGLIILLLCAFSTVAEAQVNRQISRVPDSQAHKKKQRAAADPLGDFMKNMTDDLKLNSLQQAAIHDIFERQVAQLKSIQEERVSDNEKMDRANTIIDKNEETIMALLDPEQQKKFSDMKERAKKRR